MEGTVLRASSSTSSGREMSEVNLKGNQQADHSIDMRNGGPNPDLDDDSRPKRRGGIMTASSHIITAVIGSGVLSLAWAIAQLGWVIGPFMLIAFAFVINYTSGLLAECYRSGDPLTGRRNYTYMDVVRSNLGGFKVKICGTIQYLNLFGTAVGYTIAASISMTAIERSDCFHASHQKNPCHISNIPYMITFGVLEILFSQIPNFDEISWLSIVAAVMSFTYSTIGLVLGIATVAENGMVKGSLTGITIGKVSKTKKIWHSFQALGDIAFAYAYSVILIEIQDTIKSPPSEATTMKKATLVSIIVTTAFYLLCGCFGYAAFGDESPGNLLTGFGFYNPFWLLNIGNAAIAIHLIGAYQVYCQPLFAFVERSAAKRWPRNPFFAKDFKIPLPSYQFNLNLFRLVWRTGFVILTTVVAMILPFFNDVVALLGALAFWPLTVFFPIEMYISQTSMPKWSPRWICLQTLSLICLIISLAAGVGAIAGIASDLTIYKPFTTTY